MRKRVFIGLLGVTLLFSACFDFIYDDPIDSGGITESAFKGVNATEYFAWTYVNLKTKEVTVVNEYLAEEQPAVVPEEWHFALHRYDCKTNGGAVCETSFGSIAQLQAAGAPVEGNFVEDIPTDSQIITDVSGMMEGNLVYAESDYNTEFSKWLDLDLSGMPPTYTPSNKVYLLRIKDGEMAAIRFTSFANDSGMKGYISFDYVFPLEF